MKDYFMFSVTAKFFKDQIISLLFTSQNLMSNLKHQNYELKHWHPCMYLLCCGVHEDYLYFCNRPIIQYDCGRHF